MFHNILQPERVFSKLFFLLVSEVNCLTSKIELILSLLETLGIIHYNKAKFDCITQTNKYKIIELV